MDLNIKFILFLPKNFENQIVEIEYFVLYLNMQYFEKGLLSCQESKKFFLFFMLDESPNAHE